MLLFVVTLFNYNSMYIGFHFSSPYVNQMKFNVYSLNVNRLVIQSIIHLHLVYIL